MMNNFWKNKRVLITGHTGFKGTWLSKILLLAGADVTGYALAPNSEQNLFSICDMQNKMKSIYGDIRDLAHLKKIFDETQPEIVFHLAAQPIVRESYQNPVYTFDTNIMGTVNVLECIRQSKSVRSFVNVTTDKVYKNKEWNRGYKEEDELNGFDPYSNSKSCSELVTESYKNSFFNSMGVAISTARAGNVIGGGDFAKDRIIPDCIRAAKKGEDIVVRNQNSIRPYQHVLEPLSAYLTIAEEQYKDVKYAGKYNIGPNVEDCLTTGELVTLFCNVWSKRTKKEIKWISQSDDGPHEAGFLKLDCSKLKEVFDWKQKWNIQTAIEKIVDWEQAYEFQENVNICMDKQIKDYFNN